MPSNETRPSVGGSRRRIIFPIVLLPLPLSPISETTSPGRTPKLTSRTASSGFPPKVPVLYVFEIPSSVSIASGLPAGDVVARLDLDERRLLEALLRGERAPVTEPATGRRVVEGGRPPRDPVQPLLRVRHADLGE